MNLWAASNLLWSASASAGSCEQIGMADVMSVEAPAIIVLGERHGTQPDLRRADQVATRISQSGVPVTVALEAVQAEFQGVLDDYAAGKMNPEDLPHLLEWEQRWGFPFRPYEPLVTAALYDARVVASGLELSAAPSDAQLDIPPNYIDLLRESMEGHDMPLEMESRFVTSMAWRDRRIAELATAGWDGQGILVIVVGRGHVEGGKGVTWQLERMVDVPVHGFVLAWAESPCYDGDKVWRPTIWDRLGF